jgi:hypothetical protein
MKMVKRGRGRPTVGKRIPLGLRVTPDLKRKLDFAAEETGRSQSQEAELRLERSFEREEMLPDVLTLAYGEEVAGILMTLGLVLAQTKSLAEFGMLEVGERRLSVEPVTEANFPSYALDQAIKAATEVLEEMRPGDAPSTSDLHASVTSHAMLRALSGEGVGTFARVAQDKLIPMLGQIAKRITEALKNAPIEGSQSDRPFALARAVFTASSEVGEFARTHPSPLSVDDLADFLERHLKDFLPHDWRRRGRDKAAKKRLAAQEELEAELRARA